MHLLTRLWDFKSSFTLWKWIFLLQNENRRDEHTLQHVFENSQNKTTQSCPTLCNSMDYRVHGILQVRIQEWVAIPFSRGSSQPRDRTQISHIAGEFFTSWAIREAQEHRVGILSLFQQIFPTHKSNRGLLHCRQILYQLSYQGSQSSLLLITSSEEKHRDRSVMNAVNWSIWKETQKWREKGNWMIAI